MCGWLRSNAPLYELFWSQKDYKKKHGKSYSGNGRRRLSHEICDGDPKENQCDDSQAKGNLDAAKSKVERDTKLAWTRLGITEYQYRKTLQYEGPQDAEGIGLASYVYRSAAE